ncbi:MAG: helix-turn-helix protein [Pseudoduganella sp.]|jgi:AraC-like DNA-binding protein|nr:helix-turn-helix protein [Pseudoduganella sp.]
MNYKEFPPPPGLAGLVDCLWLSDAAGGPAGGRAVSHRVLPDNRTDILWQDSGAAFFVGMMSSWFDVPAARRVRTVAVRFRAGAAGLFLGGLPLASLLDGRADLELLWGRADADRLGDALWSVARSDAERLALVTQALYARLALAAPGARAASALALRAVAELEARGGALRVETLADGLDVSRQHLAAQFREHVGLSPKLFARVCRFRAARAAALDAPRDRDWAALALDCGYFDQSHLIRDFQDFTGASPDAHLGKR